MYARLWNGADKEFDAAKRAAMFIRMNDIVVENVAVIPEIWRNRTYATGKGLRDAEPSGWDSTLWQLAYWTREA